MSLDFFWVSASGIFFFGYHQGRFQAVVDGYSIATLALMAFIY